MTVISVQIALTLIGAGLFGYGILVESDGFRLAAIGTLTVALMLRFFRKRARKDNNPPS